MINNHRPCPKCLTHPSHLAGAGRQARAPLGHLGERREVEQDEHAPAHPKPASRKTPGAYTSIGLGGSIMLATPNIHRLETPSHNPPYTSMMPGGYDKTGLRT